MSSKCYIEDVSFYIPEMIFSNQDLINIHKIRMKPPIVERMVGITHRAFAKDNEAASDLAVKAINKIIPQNFKGPIFLSSISGDYLTPSTSSIIKNKLGLSDLAPCFDLNAACAGQIFALDLATNYLVGSQYNKAIVVASELRSRYLNFHDRRTAFLFADGASAFLINKEKKGLGSINWISSQTKASDNLDIYIKSGGSKFPLDEMALSEQSHKISMNNGPSIVNKTTSLMIDNIHSTLQANNENLSDYNFFIFHQGNSKLIQTICSKIGINESQTHINFEKYGNSSSASMGIAFAEAVSLKKITPGMRVLVIAMGAGYHVGMASITWGEP